MILFFLLASFPALAQSEPCSSEIEERLDEQIERIDDLIERLHTLADSRSGEMLERSLDEAPEPLSPEAPEEPSEAREEPETLDTSEEPVEANLGALWPLTAPEWFFVSTAWHNDAGGSEQ